MKEIVPLKEDAVIDVHAHVYPRPALALADTDELVPWMGAFVGREAGGPPLFVADGKKKVFGSPFHFEGPQARVKRMDELGVDVQVLSVLSPFFRYHLAGAEGLEAARAINDDIADLCRTWPDRFLGLATLPFQDTDRAIAEVDRAINELGLVGVAMGTHINDSNLDDPSLFPIFEAVAANRGFIFVHPNGNRSKPNVMNSYYLNNLVGNLWESAVAIGCLVFGGVLERLPDLTFCFAHGGGYGVFAAGRFRHGFAMRPEPREKISTPPRDLIGRLYVDSLVHDDVALRYLLDTLGPTHVLLGSDFPADMGPQDPVAEIAASNRLDDAEKRAVLGGNAVNLFRSLGHVVAPEEPAPVP